MTLLIGALTLGGILALLAIGVYLSFRIFSIADMTVDGAVTLGGAVTGVLLIQFGAHPIQAMLFSVLAGMLAGAVTGIMQTTFRINSLLAGILMMTALYSINLRIMQKSNLPLHDTTTLSTLCHALGRSLFESRSLDLLGWSIAPDDLLFLLCVFAIVLSITLILWMFLRTDLGTAMRASGDNPEMIRALGGNVEAYRIAGLALSNGLVALSGSIWAQYQNFADAQMGIGMIVWGLASVIVGEALIAGSMGVGVALAGAILGSLLFRELIAIALSFGLNPNDLKLVTAFFVFLALTLPRQILKMGPSPSVKPS